MTTAPHLGLRRLSGLVPIVVVRMSKVALMSGVLLEALGTELASHACRRLRLRLCTTAAPVAATTARPPAAAALALARALALAAWS